MNTPAAAGAVSRIPAMAVVWPLVKRTAFLAYVLFGLGGAMMAGAAFGAIIG